MSQHSPFLSSTRRRLLAELEEARDIRSIHEKLKDAIDCHLRNARLCKSLCEGSIAIVDPVAFGAAERAYLSSQAELFCLVEDFCLVPAARLREALAA